MEDNENKNAKQTIAEKKARDKETTAKNDEAYSDKNIKKREEELLKVKVEKGMKEKLIERVTYRNGVVKNRLKGLYFNGVIKYGKGPIHSNMIGKKAK